jgi:hypothetical protein
MEKWRDAFRKIAAGWSKAGLFALYRACRDDDPRLIQGVFTRTDLRNVVIGACALRYPEYPGLYDENAGFDHVETIAAQVAYCDAAFPHCNDAAAFVEWYDATPREDAIAALLNECVYEWQRRYGAEQTALLQSAAT